MELIDKTALIAEIKRRIDLLKANEMLIVEYKNMLSFLDTLEVKEVDLEKELYDFIKKQKAWIKNDRVIEYDNGDSFNHIYDLEDVAKHFFELGLGLKANGAEGICKIETECPNFDEAQGTNFVRK